MSKTLKTSQRHNPNAWTQSAIVFYLALQYGPIPLQCVLHLSLLLHSLLPWVVFLKWVLTPSIPRKFSSCLRSLISFAQMLEYLSCELSLLLNSFLSMKLLWKAFLESSFSPVLTGSIFILILQCLSSKTDRSISCLTGWRGLKVAFRYSYEYFKCGSLV